MNNKKTLLIILTIVLLGAGAAFRFLNGKSGENSGSVPDSSGLIVGKNSIYVPDQEPSQNVDIGLAFLERPGFVVIHEDKDGAPGAILGASRILEAGENKDGVIVTLSRTAQENETLYAMIHIDDGDGTFNPAKDAPAIDELGHEPVMMIFVVSKDFTEPSDFQL